MGVLQNELFLGNKGTRTMFCLSQSSGVDIQRYSMYKTESEVLLLPGRRLQVTSGLDQGGLQIVQLEETFPSELKETPKNPDEGDIEAHKLGDRCKDEGNLKEAVRFYTSSASKGNKEGLVRLGDCYRIGAGVQKDEKAAVRCYTLAVAQGHPVAQNHLGSCYFHGVGVPPDIQKAVTLYTLSANQGYPLAQCNLGLKYRDGVGVERNLFEAKRLLSLSAKQGNLDAQRELTMLTMQPQKLALEGDIVKLGDWYKDEGNLKEAVRFYTSSSLKGNKEGLVRLGDCYRIGVGVQKDEKAAVRCYTLAVEQGHPVAQNHLGSCYFHGMGVSPDIQKAVTLYTLSANQGYQAAQYNLGLKYRDGVGVERNLFEAKRLLSLSAKQGNLDAQRELTKIM